MRTLRMTHEQAGMALSGQMSLKLNAGEKIIGIYSYSDFVYAVVVDKKDDFTKVKQALEKNLRRSHGKMNLRDLFDPTGK